MSTETGIRCAHCKGRHETVQRVRECSWEEAEMRAEAEAEYRAEQANERYFEDRGYWEAKADEDRERAMGIQSFGDAMREAEGWQ